MTFNKTGIIGIEYAFPKYVISHDDLADTMGIDRNKFKIGLGLSEMSAPCEGEDVVSLAMTATSRLMKKYHIDTNSVGRIDVGSESNFDSSKSIKSFLMDLFPDNKNILGADNVNACYGGTNALLNAFFYMDSTYWDGRYCIVVCTDISRYNDPAAVPTSGAGAVAILLGINPVFTLDKEIFHYFDNEFDFFKPVETYPFCIVNGKVSLEVYKKSFSTLFKKMGNNFDYLCMHSPYPKLPQKIISEFEIDFSKLEPSLWVARKNGNSYTASLYFCLISLIYKIKEMKIGEKILMFSYGSGIASSMFKLEKVSDKWLITDLEERLSLRERLEADKYLSNVMKYEGMKDFVPNDLNLVEDSYSLKEIVGYKRYYRANN